MLLRHHLSSQPRVIACLHLPRAAAAVAEEGSGSAAAAGLDVPSSMTVVGSAGLWLRLPFWNCRSPLVSYSGSLLPPLHTLVPWYHEHRAVWCCATLLFGMVCTC
jgi:hypothetical protein